jgi:hypothetical protein
MQNLHTRLARLEDAISVLQRQEAHQFAIEGPANMPSGAAFTYLRECGHDVPETGLNIVRVFIDAEDGRPVDLPLNDLTREQSLGAFVAASPLHLQPGRN